MKITISGFKDYAELFDAVTDEQKEKMYKRAVVGAHEVAKNAKRLIMQQSAGERAFRYRGGGKTEVVVSKPGDAPNNDLGTLVASINVRSLRGLLAAEVFTKLKYAVYLEEGTEHMAARPFLSVALKMYIAASRALK